MILLSGLFAPFFLPSWVVNMKRATIRQEVSALIDRGIDSDILTLLEFKLDEIDYLVKWEHSREFKYQGEMYDVVRMDTSNQTLQIWCWKDHDETNLNENLKELVQQSPHDQQQNNQQYLRLLHFYSHLYYAEKNDLTNLTEWNLWTFIPYVGHYEKVYLSPPNPPPIIS